MITYRKSEFVKCKSIKIATLRGYITYPITVGKLYEIQRGPLMPNNYHCKKEFFLPLLVIINDRGSKVTFESIKAEKLFMDKSEIREEKLNKVLYDK